MTQILSTLKRSGRAAVVALVLGAATVTAMPTQAMAQSPSFSFSIDLGGGSLRFRGGDFSRKFCLSNNQVRRELRKHGFRDIDIVRSLNRNRVEVIARYGRNWYVLRVDRCSGQVRIVERLRRGFPGRGFGLQFNFGM